jgi:spermidine/putrescine transport system ATP-binding protein
MGAEGARATLCIRPEHIGPGDGPPGPCRVVETVFQGVHRRVRARPLAQPGVELLALLPVGRDAAPGDEIALAIDPDHVTVLEE